MLFPEAHRTELTHELLRLSCVEPTLRPTELTIPHFRALSDAYGQLCSQSQGLISYEFREEQRLKRLHRKQGTPHHTEAPPAPVEEEEENKEH